MAEIRSFVVGVVVAGVLLGIIAVALGAFSGDDNSTPTARVIATLPPSPTTQATPRTGTTTQPGSVATNPAASPTPAVTAPATGTAASPTPAPTDTPAPQPTQNPVAAYVGAASIAVTDLGAQIDYLVATGSSNPAGSNQSASTVKDLAARLQGLSAPACLANAHATLTQGAAAASNGADQLISALAASNQGAVNAALSTLSGAKNTLAQGAAAVSAATC